MPTKYSPKVILSIGFTILFWASAFVAIRDALKCYSPGSLAVLRFSTASLVLGIFAVKMKVRVPKLKDLPYFLILGMIGIACYHITLNYGEKTVTAATSSFIINSIPILTALISFFFLKERIRAWRWIGIFISFGGIALISFSEGKVGSFNWGTLLVLISAISGSLYVIFQKKLMNRYSAFEVTTWAIWIGTICMLPFIPSLLKDIQHATVSTTLDIVYLGIFPAAISYVLWGYALSYFESATKLTTWLYLSPLLTTVIGIIWIREIPGIFALLGGLIVLSGMGLAMLKGK